MNIKQGILAIVFAFLAVATSAAAETIRIVTSTPDLSDIASRIGGEKVSATSLTRGVEDPHKVPLKPSFLPLLNRADVVIVVGMEFEHSWMPALLEASRNEKILPGRPGYIDASARITPLSVPQSLDRSQGELHPSGNPHYNLDPGNGFLIADEIAAKLSALYPADAAAFESGRKAFHQALSAKLSEWDEKGKALKGTRFVSYHSAWEYFARRFGMEIAGSIELKPGIEPTPRHIEELISRMKEQEVRLVVRERHFSERWPRAIAEQTGARVVTLPIVSGGSDESKNYFALFDFIIAQFLGADEDS